jgi:hypothetical protein
VNYKRTGDTRLEPPGGIGSGLSGVGVGVIHFSGGGRGRQYV